MRPEPTRKDGTLEVKFGITALTRTRKALIREIGSASFQPSNGMTTSLTLARRRDFLAVQQQPPSAGVFTTK